MVNTTLIAQGIDIDVIYTDYRYIIILESSI